MSSYHFTPAPTQNLTSSEQIRAYANPTRMTILALLATEELSVSRVARQLGVHPANLTHHFKALEKAGLIALVEKRETGKNLEKFYRALAYQFIISAGEQPVDQELLALSILRDNLNAALQTLKNPQDEHMILAILRSVRLHPDDLELFRTKLMALADDFTSRATESGEAYSLNASIYPIIAGNAPTRELLIGASERAKE